MLCNNQISVAIKLRYDTFDIVIGQVLQHLPYKGHVGGRQIILGNIHHLENYVAIRMFYFMSVDDVLNDIAGIVSSAKSAYLGANSEISAAQISHVQTPAIAC